MKNVTIMTLTELENYIVSHTDGVDWWCISIYQKLSEEFIEKHAGEVDWWWISERQKLSQKFIEKHTDKVNWNWISKHQKLSEEFIEKHADEVDWEWISIYQKLSEEFIEKHADKVDWGCISVYQKLSEKFIERHAGEVNWNWIPKYQKLSEKFIERYTNELYASINDNWNYKSADFKKAAVEATGLYECHEDFFYAYKGIRSDRYSNFNFQYRYMPGETYECFADASSEENSFGLSAWTKEEAGEYCSELVVKVKIYYEDVARVVHNGGKIRCSKLTVME